MQTHFLETSDGHRLHIMTAGNPNGIPVVFVHGGPGGGFSEAHVEFFDLDKYRVVLFDQRGAGLSVPHASLENNTTQHLIDDMEMIREFFSIDQWLLFGGSWGSTLALLYAQTYPQRVSGLILRGIFLCRETDIAWFYQDGASRIFPEAWAGYEAPIEPQDRHDMVASYHKLLTGDDELQRLRAARAWSHWEASTAVLLPTEVSQASYSEDYQALSLARIECHYFINKGFLRPNQILDDMDKIKHLPGIIVQGRYDCICPPEQAYALHQAWPQSSLKMIPDAGHSSMESGIKVALQTALLEMAKVLA